MNRSLKTENIESPVYDFVDRFNPNSEEFGFPFMKSKTKEEILNHCNGEKKNASDESLRRIWGQMEYSDRVEVLSEFVKTELLDLIQSEEVKRPVGNGRYKMEVRSTYLLNRLQGILFRLDWKVDENLFGKYLREK